ncbi:type II toxin-antitoxin system VapC family toxin [Aquisalimonas sp.]|uniref:type II toxin-antitoxin system VapC family toxin n=1 Tax=Aquisalimonas sp. TaxID=1872621 RepID=UPI0025BDB6B3|nr:type II toxin-antitoxin system VapC family toxin [Aquisalimonas sp.]
MHLLLDTHVLLWAAGEPGRLTPRARELISSTENVLWFSAASIWEVAIKSGLGRSDFRADPHLLCRGLIENGYRELAITSQHTAAVTHLPDVHKDPFDRILVVQAETEGLLLLTVDEVLQRYPGPIQRI